MNESERLARQVERALEGEAWHGPSVRELLEGVSADDAVARPIRDGHSIAEIVAHATTWHGVVTQRLKGESPEVSNELDWPVVSRLTEAEWEGARSSLLRTGDELRRTVVSFPVARLHEERAGVSGTWYDLIVGELQHVLYHAGQIALLRKAPRGAK
jgi:hypothetical protein